MTEMTFYTAMKETVDCARVSRHSYYLYKSKSQGWLIAAIKWDDWLFQAYPNGRKKLSINGKVELELAKSDNCPDQLPDFVTDPRRRM